MQRIYEVALRAPTESEPKGRVVGIKEMGTEDLLRAFRQTGQEMASEMGANIQTKLAALRLCVVEDNGETLTYSQLQGGQWDQRFSLKESFVLAAAWSQIHEPSKQDLEGLGGGLRVRSGD